MARHESDHGMAILREHAMPQRHRLELRALQPIEEFFGVAQQLHASFSAGIESGRRLEVGAEQLEAVAIDVLKAGKSGAEDGPVVEAMQGPPAREGAAT